MTPKEYKQMMDYLTRSGIKDKVKFASDVGKPVDKFEVQQIKLFNAFNRRNPRADGGRILLGNGGYANYTQKQINEINKLIKNTDLNQSDIAKEVNKKIKKNITDKVTSSTVTYYGRKYFNVPKREPLNEEYKKRFTFKDRKGKLLTDILEKKDLVESIKTDVANKLTKQQIVDKYRIGGKGEKLLPSGVKQIGKGTLEEIYEELDIVRGRADLRKVDINTPENKKNLKNIKKFFSDPKLSRAEAYDKINLSRGQVDKLLATYKREKGEPLIVSRKDLGVQFEGAGQERNVFKQKTKELQKFQTFLKKYKNKPLRSGTVELAKAIKEFGTNPVGFQQNLSMLRRIYKGQERPGFKIDNELKSIIGKFPISTALTSDVLIEAGYTPKQIDKLNKAQAIIRKLDADQGFFLNQLEHKVPKAIASELLNKGQITQAQYKDIIGRITPVTTDLNQWKKQYDLQRLMNVKNYLASNMEADDLKKFNEVENDIIKTAKKISGGYDIGKIEINADGKINLVSPDEVFKTKQVQGIGPGSRSLIDYYKNIKYHNILAKKYNSNKSDAAFGTLRAYRAGADVPIFDEKITNEISKLSSSEDFTKYLIKNTDGPLFKGFTKLVSPQMRRKLLSAGKIGGAATLATLIPSMLLAKTPDGTDATGFTTGEKLAGAGTAAGAYKFRKPIIKGAKAVGRGALKLLGPLAVPLEAGFVLSDLKSGSTVPEAIADVALMGGIFREKDKRKFIEDKYGTETLNRYVAAKTPGITDVMDIPTALPALSQELQAIDAEADAYLQTLRNQRAQEFERKSALPRPEINPFQAAGGGIAKLAGVDSGPPPESGPMSQGLPGLLKRVRNL